LGNKKDILGKAVIATNSTCFVVVCSNKVNHVLRTVAMFSYSVLGLQSTILTSIEREPSIIAAMCSITGRTFLFKRSVLNRIR